MLSHLKKKYFGVWLHEEQANFTGLSKGDSILEENVKNLKTKKKVLPIILFRLLGIFFKIYEAVFRVTSVT